MLARCLQGQRGEEKRKSKRKPLAFSVGQKEREKVPVVITRQRFVPKGHIESQLVLAAPPSQQQGPLMEGRNSRSPVHLAQGRGHSSFLCCPLLERGEDERM